jgi:hypothetical protein
MLQDLAALSKRLALVNENKCISFKHNQQLKSIFMLISMIVKARTNCC